MHDRKINEATEILRCSINLDKTFSLSYIRRRKMLQLMDVEVINMETNPVAKHTLQICHTALTGALDAALAVQSQSQKTMEVLLEHSPVIPREGKRAVSDWFEAFRQQTTAMKGVIDEGFKPFHLYYEE
jgi:hypothetical protein